MDIRDPQLAEIFASEQPRPGQSSRPPRYPYRSLLKILSLTLLSMYWGFINILQCCVKYRVKKVIYISSGGAIYGEADEFPPQRTIIPLLFSVYAINKMAGEHYLHLYHHQLWP
jgi:UDP-glucose 4-epimerase